MLKHALAALFFGAFVFVSCWLSFSAPSQAQITRSVRIELADNTPRVFIGPQSYLTQDKSGQLNANALATRHQNNLKGTLQSSPVLNFGPNAQPVWLTFSVTNNSSQENWVLHFGHLLDGRFGLIHNIQVYDTSNNKVVLQSAFNGQNAENLNKLNGPALPLSIAPGKSTLFAVMLESSYSPVHSITPSLMSVEYYQSYVAGASIVPKLFWMVILGLTGFFAGISAVRRNPLFLYFVGLFISYAAIFFAFNALFLISAAYGSAILLALVLCPIFICIFMTRHFFGLHVGHDNLSILFFLGAGGTVFGFLLSQFLANVGGGTHQYLTFVPLCLTSAFLCVLSLDQARQERHGALYLSAGWGCVLIALTALFIASMHWIDNTGFLLAVYWGMLIPQGAFFAMAALQYAQTRQKEEISSVARENRAAQSLARIKQSRETADQARLLRVIERERELMSDLREREMQRTQEMRKAKDAADEANRAKSGFLAVVSHEIRTPMNGLLGMLRLLNDTKMSKEQNEYVQAIQNSGDTMMALLNDILDFEKIESGNMELEIIDFDVIKLIEGVVTLMSGHAAERNIELKADIDDNVPAMIKGDPTRLRQVLLNLINNAVKFTSEGSVMLTLKSETNDSPAFQNVTFSVQDTGIGISEEAQKNLFNAFIQADKSTSRKYGGTGLGLAICRNLVEAMGSKIEIKSREGEGSVFFFTLKMESTQQDFSENAVDIAYNEPTRAPITPMRILVIDDNEMNRRVLDGFLKRDEHETMLLESAEEALEICKAELFDTIITDINLHGMDGTEFAETLQQGRNMNTKTPIIALSGNVGAEDRQRYQDAGMVGFLAKPLDPQALFEMLVSVSENIEPDREQELHEVNLDGIELDEEFDSFDIPEEGDEPESAPKDDPSLFDPNLLQGLIASLPMEQFEELLKGFLDKTDELVETLGQMSEDTDMKETYERAHELKGMAANFGLNGISAIAAEIEDHAKNAQSNEALGAIQKLPTMNEKAQTALKDWVAAQAS